MKKRWQNPEIIIIKDIDDMEEVNINKTEVDINETEEVDVNKVEK